MVHDMAAEMKKEEHYQRRSSNIAVRRSSLAQLEPLDEDQLQVKSQEINDYGEVNLNAMTQRLGGQLEPLAHQAHADGYDSFEDHSMGVASGGAGSFAQHTAGNFLQRRSSVTAVYGEFNADAVNKAVAAQPQKRLLDALNSATGGDGEPVETVVESQSDPALPPGMRGAAPRRGSVAVEARKTSVSANSVMSKGAQRRASIQAERRRSVAAVKDPELKQLIMKQQRAERAAWKHLSQHVGHVRKEFRLDGPDWDIWQLFVDTLAREPSVDSFVDAEAAVAAFAKLRLRRRLPLPGWYRKRRDKRKDLLGEEDGPSAADVLAQIGGDNGNSLAGQRAAATAMLRKEEDAKALAQVVASAFGKRASVFVLLQEAGWVQDTDARAAQLRGGADVHLVAFMQLEDAVMPLAEGEESGASAAAGRTSSGAGSYVGEIYSYLDRERNTHRAVSTGFCRALNFDYDFQMQKGGIKGRCGGRPDATGGTNGGSAKGMSRSMRVQSTLAFTSMAVAACVGSARFAHLYHLKIGGVTASTMQYLAIALLAGAMKRIRVLQLLLPGDCATDEARQLARALASPNCGKLRELLLGGSMAGEEILGTLASTGFTDKAALPQLHTLDLGQFGGRVKGCTMLAKALGGGGLKRLHSLQLGGNRMADAARQIFSALARAHTCGGHLRVLGLASNNLGVKQAECVAKALGANAVPKLEVLDLANNKIGDEGCRAIARAFHHIAGEHIAEQEQGGGKGVFQLTSLSLAGCHLSEASLVPLIESLGKTHQGLTRLDLSSNKLMEPGVAAMATAAREGGLQRLCSLQLGYNQLGQAGVEALLAIALMTETLRSLDLTCNAIGLMGCIRVAVAVQAVGGFPRLEALHVGRNMLPGEVLKDAKEHFSDEFQEQVMVEFGKSVKFPSELHGVDPQ